MAEGWIKLHRQLIDSEWFTDVNTNHLFMYCLIRANHKDAKWQGIDIKRGEFITSLDTLSRSTGLSVMQIRTSLKKLIVTSNLTSKSTNKNRLISVVNYAQYQDDNKLDNKPVTSQQQTDNKPVTTDKNNNNNNNEKNDKKVSKPRVGLEELSVNHIKDWLAKKRSEGRYIQHDEHAILETFKNYCESTTKPNGKPKYENFIAAYRNAFEWDKCQPRKGVNQNDKHQRSLEAATRGHIRAENPDF